MAKKKVSAKGGGRKFVTSAEEMEVRDKIVENQAAARRLRRADVDGDDKEEGDEEGEEEEEEEAGGEDIIDKMRKMKVTSAAAAGEDAEEEFEVKPASATDGLIEISNPNMPKKGAISVKDMDGSGAPAKLSRREREAVEKERAERSFWEKHERGETDQAKADLARLALIKKQREEAKLRKELEEKAKLEAKKAEVETEATVPDDGPAKAGPKSKGKKDKSKKDAPKKEEEEEEDEDEVDPEAPRKAGPKSKGSRKKKK